MEQALAMFVPREQEMPRARVDLMIDIGFNKDADAKPFPPSLRWAGYTLGFGIGGFFDGILLHQVLQWHHLLAGVEGPRFRDLRVQILADGLFHVVMYVITVVGLFLLWRSRALFGRAGADRLLTSSALIGFGAWHVIDGVLSHWVLQIHRIKMDSTIPLFWDLAWFAIFGILFLVAGWVLRRGYPKLGGKGGFGAAALALLAIIGGAGVSVPPSGASAVVVVFRPGTTPAEEMAAMFSVGGRLVWTDSSDHVWAIEVPEHARAAKLYAHGALFVSTSLLPISCLRWSRAQV